MANAAERLTLPVRGMHCAACVGNVERALTSVPGVDEATVNLATEKATIAFDPTRTDVHALQDAVARAGYQLVEPRAAAALTPDREQAARADVGGDSPAREPGPTHGARRPRRARARRADG